MIDDMQFRKTVGKFATGVTVITAKDLGGNPRGFTANAFTSLSLEPPQIMVCVDKGGDTYPLMREGGIAFAVNILADHQEHLSKTFASKGGTEKFADVGYRERKTGAPILEGVLAYLECRSVAQIEGGDHIVIVGEVIGMDANEDADPLLFYGGKYLRPVGAR